MTLPLVGTVVDATLTPWSYSSCWIIIEKKVYDVTDFVPVSVCLSSFLHCALIRVISAEQQHPGGPRMILNFAGRDATHAFKSLHSLDVLAARLPPHKHLGNLA